MHGLCAQLLFTFDPSLPLESCIKQFSESKLSLFTYKKINGGGKEFYAEHLHMTLLKLFSNQESKREIEMK